MKDLKDMIMRRRPAQSQPEPGAPATEAPQPETAAITAPLTPPHDFFYEAAREARNRVPRPSRPTIGEHSGWTMPDGDSESDLTRSVLDHLADEADPDELDPDAADLDATDLDAAVAELQEAPQEMPKAPPQSVAKIWDRPRPQAVMPPPVERPLTRVVQSEPTVSAAPRRPDRNPETPRGVTSERVKTRLLGFHGAAAEADLFEAAPERGAGAVPFFPIGWLVVVDGPGRGASFTLTAGLSTIGRDADQTVPLDYGDTSISRERHVSIAYDAEDKRTWVGHGGKSNIVRLNDKPLLSTEELNHGDLIRVGKTTLRYVALCDATFDWGDPVEDEDIQHG